MNPAPTCDTLQYEKCLALCLPHHVPFTCVPVPSACRVCVTDIANVTVNGFINTIERIWWSS